MRKIERNADGLLPILPENRIVLCHICYHGIGAFITKSGDLYLWGNCNWGTDVAFKKTPFKFMEGIAAFAYDNNPFNERFGAISQDGTLYLWGDNYYGAVGNGESRYDREYTGYVMKPIPIMEQVAAVWKY